jgi:regulatory protein NPR1
LIDAMDASAVVSLARLSTHLECLLNPAFLGRADAAVVLAEGGAVVGAYSCILAARSPVLHRHISSTPSGERPRLELAELVRGGHRVGREALHAVLAYMYAGVFKAPLQKCADGTCGHAACRPAIDFVVESTYAACGFQIPELVSLCQVNRRVGSVLAPISIAILPCVLPPTPWLNGKWSASFEKKTCSLNV